MTCVKKLFTVLGENACGNSYATYACTYYHSRKVKSAVIVVVFGQSSRPCPLSKRSASLVPLSDSLIHDMSTLLQTAHYLLRAFEVLHRPLDLARQKTRRHPRLPLPPVEFS